MGIGSKTAKTFIGKVPWVKVIEKAGGAKDRGDRLWPSRNSKNDSALNFRLDKGSTDLETGNVEIILQANKNAEDPEVKKAAQKDSDAILGKVLVDPKNPNAEEAKDTLIASFKKRN
ncbi:hypothetical protein BDW62DRAFT_194607 [Aspergillus aurantiobrunneus]